MPVPNQIVSINQVTLLLECVHLDAPNLLNDTYIRCSCRQVNRLNKDSGNIAVPSIANILLS